jgi:YVTN family beta-propeller protein
MRREDEPARVFDWIEGSRAFDVTWGLTTAALCLAVGVPILRWTLPAHRRSFFGPAIDPSYRLQVGYGVFCLAMAFTNAGCRAIPHDGLALVHLTFFAITVALVLGLGPRVVVMATAPRRGATAARAIVIAAFASALLATAVLASPGVTLLPTGWRIRGPEGAVAIVGTLPEGLVLSRDGSRAIELEGGYRKPALRVLDAATLKELRTVPLGGAYGVPLRDADGDGVWVSIAGTFQEQIAHIDTATGAVDRDVSLPLPFFPVAIARAPDGSLAVAGDLGDRVAFVDPAAERVSAKVDVGRHPAALAFSTDGSTLYVADRGESSVDVVNVAAHAVEARIAVGLHPAALALAGDRLYVADSDDDDVAVIDLTTRRVIERAAIPFRRADTVGTSPNALVLDGDRLYVSCGAANAIAVFRTTTAGLAPVGAIPTGWYPTAVAVDRAHGVLYVADGKGESGHANPGYAGGTDVTRLANPAPKQYIADQLVGSIRRIAIPDDAALARGNADVRDLAQHEGVPPSPIVRAGGPIKHVIYVIKENRSYDQVLGDVAGADGDPQLVLFGDRVTPNQHAIVGRFGVFDRFFENAHISADGHNWSTAAIANDYLEKMWPADYANRRPMYDFEDAAEASIPHAGYLWDDAVAHGVSLRNYGEFATEGPSKPAPVSVSSDVLRPRTDRAYATFDMAVLDVDRFTEWKREFDGYERSHTLPQLEIVRFPRDHTSGTRPGSATPKAMVADNDLAVGRLVDAVSHSADWASTAIFILEDDAQNGPDHVDEQRSTFYLASPYAAGGVQHASYTQASVLRTIEILLGMPPMTPYDAGARPLSAAFRATPNLQPFDALPARTDLDAVNPKTAYRAADSARLDFAQADRVDDGTLNDILWHAVKGPSATPPPYGLFTAHGAGGATARDSDR